MRFGERIVTLGFVLSEISDESTLLQLLAEGELQELPVRLRDDAGDFFDVRSEVVQQLARL